MGHMTIQHARDGSCSVRGGRGGHRGGVRAVDRWQRTLVSSGRGAHGSFEEEKDDKKDEGSEVGWWRCRHDGRSLYFVMCGDLLCLLGMLGIFFLTSDEFFRLTRHGSSFLEEEAFSFTRGVMENLAVACPLPTLWRSMSL